jgi:octopine/nopaline transport system substrate-binding protein
MKTRGLAFAVALAMAAVGVAPGVAQAKEWKTVTIALEGAFEPWNLTNPDGSIGGFEPDLAKYLCAHAKVQCKLVATDFDSVIPSMLAGKFDVIMDSLSITPERKQTIAFSIPYAATPVSFAALKTGPFAKLAGTGTTIKLGMDTAEQKKAMTALRTALKGKTIGVQAATNFAKFATDNFQDVATIREYKTSPEHDLDLLAGRIDVAFDDATYFNAAFAKPENAELALTGPEIAGPVWGEGEGIGLRKADTDLKAKFDSAIKAAEADGTLKKLSMKWFKLDVSP